MVAAAWARAAELMAVAAAWARAAALPPRLLGQPLLVLSKFRGCSGFKTIAELADPMLKSSCLPAS